MHSTQSMSLNQLTQVWFFWGKDVWTCSPILISLQQPLHSNQVATMACAGLGGVEELHANNMTLSKVVGLVAEIQDLNLGVWSRKAAMPNSSDQMSVLLPAANRLYAPIHSSVSALGRVVQLETYKQQSPLLLKGKKHRNQVTWCQIFDHTYLVLYSLSSRQVFVQLLLDH